MCSKARKRVPTFTICENIALSSIGIYFGGGLPAKLAYTPWEAPTILTSPLMVDGLEIKRKWVNLINISNTEIINLKLVKNLSYIKINEEIHCGPFGLDKSFVVAFC